MFSTRSRAAITALALLLAGCGGDDAEQDQEIASRADLPRCAELRDALVVGQPIPDEPALAHCNGEGGPNHVGAVLDCPDGRRWFSIPGTNLRGYLGEPLQEIDRQTTCPTP